MQITWLWLVGFVPYSIKRMKRQEMKKEESIFAVKALFWRFTIRWKERQCSWELDIPFIEHLRHTVRKK